MSSLRIGIFVLVSTVHLLLQWYGWKIHLGERLAGPLPENLWEICSVPLFELLPRRMHHLYFYQILFANSLLWGGAAVWLSALIPMGRRRKRKVAAVGAVRRAETPRVETPPPAPVHEFPKPESTPPPGSAGRRAVPGPGVRVFGNGRYKVIEKLGGGAFGTVYRARDLTRGLDVALKTIDIHSMDGAEVDNFRKAFQREAATAGRLDHPGIVPVFDHDADAPEPFIVMSLVKGGTLKDRLDRLPGHRLSAREVRDLGLQIADALEYARQHGVRAHRDIKPANIFCADAGCKIGDFGVARPQRALSSQTIFAQAGTPGYMAPEQTIAPDTVDWRADLFALCCVLYEALTGKRPFPGIHIDTDPYEDPAALREIVRAAYPPPPPLLEIVPDLEPALAQAIERGLHFDRSRRYASWSEFSAALRGSAR